MGAFDDASRSFARPDTWDYAKDYRKMSACKACGIDSSWRCVLKQPALRRIALCEGPGAKPLHTGCSVFTAHVTIHQ